MTDILPANKSVAKSNLHYKPVDDEVHQIIAPVLPIGRYRQSRPSHDLCKPANGNEDQIVTGVLPIGSGNYRSL